MGPHVATEGPAAGEHFAAEFALVVWFVINLFHALNWHGICDEQESELVSN